MVILVAAIIAFTITSCGQANFAEITVKDLRTEEETSGNRYLVLSMQIENLTDSNLYIESSSPTNEEGEKHLWFVVKDADDNEYKATYYSEIVSNISPMSASPRTTTTGEIV